MTNTIPRVLLLSSLFLSNMLIAQQKPKFERVDVCVYGGTSAGVIAAYTAARMNKRVLLVEPGYHLGGLSAGGLGFTDIGNKHVVTGLARDFYRHVGNYYGKFEQWTFEPKVAESIFKDYMVRVNCQVLYGERIVSAQKTGTVITSIALEDSKGPGSPNITVLARQFIDCSYEGDLMAMAGVSYTTGRESNTQYNETVNGVQLKEKHQFPDGIDPYKIPGDASSGLVWGVSTRMLAPTGSGDKSIQAYNFRICLSSDPANQVPITRPGNYDSTRYELLLRYLAVKPSKDLWGFVKMDLMPNSKTDINNNGPFSTDMIGMNYAYPEGDYKTRAAIIKEHEDYSKGFLYFAGHDPRMPENLRAQMLKWGYPKDEYTDNGNWTTQLYVREARRMLGEYVMTQANCMGKEVVEDEIGKGAYTMDSHNAQRLVVNGMVKNEGDVQLKVISPYPVAYRSITPRRAQCSNLLVPVCLSASHMAYGSIRMEPVFMVLAQSAATASCLAIDLKLPVQNVDVKRLQTLLKNDPLADHSTPEILVDNDDLRQIVTVGNWKRELVDGYGPSYLVADDSSGKMATVSFYPEVKKAGIYRIYLYCPRLPGAADSTKVDVFDGRKNVSRWVHKNEINVVGQTSGEWVLITTTVLPVGKKPFLRVSQSAANGVVVADAVLLVPEYK
jgi:hypothetical protein